mmetsp:Transcript_19389/g.33318  ORF Transcript_19389/g.33318 Transcript_19389/m.33318 type:complete len:382 (-) Transcript_19389:31-1176(-)
MRVLEAVQGKGTAQVPTDELLPDVPLGEDVLDGQERRPCREAFVEPEVRPPFHCDKVAEPLMGKLVGNDLSNSLLHGGGGVDGIDEHRNLAERDAPPVFHCAGREVRNRQAVDLGQGIGDGEVGGEVREGLKGDLQRKCPEVSLPDRSEDPDRYTLRRGTSDEVELAHDEGEEVRRHDRRPGEPNQPLAVGERLGLCLRHVRYGRAVGRHNEHHVERRLERRLVPAREGPTSIRGFKLGGGHVARLSANGVLAPIETVHPVVQDALEGHLQLGGPSGERLGEPQEEVLVLVAHQDDLGRLAGGPFSKNILGGEDLELGSVEGHLSGRNDDLDVDLNLAFESEGGNVRLELKGIMLRANVCWEQNPLRISLQVCHCRRLETE